MTRSVFKFNSEISTLLKIERNVLVRLDLPISIYLVLINNFYIFVEFYFSENLTQTNEDEDLLVQVEMLNSAHMEFSQSHSVAIICISTMINIVLFNVFEIVL